MENLEEKVVLEIFLRKLAAAVVVFAPLSCYLLQYQYVDLSPSAEFVLVFPRTGGSCPSHKCSANLEIVVQTDVQYSVTSSLQGNNMVCI